MNDTTLRLFLKVLNNQFLRSVRQWSIFFLLILFCMFSTLVYNYIYGFKEVFIERLKGVYPVAYIHSMGKQIPSFDPMILHQQEFFHLTQNFRFQYRPESHPLTILDVAFRATTPQHLPTIITTSDLENDHQIWVNQSMWNKISAGYDFDGKGVFLLTRQNEHVYVDIHQFDLLGSQPWIVFPKTLFLECGHTMNITTIYPKSYMTESHIQKEYASNGIYVATWHERLPFFHKVFYQLTQRIYYTIIAGFFILLVIMLFGVLQDTFDEFSKLITFSSRYGVHEWFVQTFFICLVLVYILAVLFVSNVCVIRLDFFISEAIPILQKIPAHGVSILKLSGLIPVFCLISYILIYRNFRKQILAVEV